MLEGVPLPHRGPQRTVGEGGALRWCQTECRVWCGVQMCRALGGHNGAVLRPVRMQALHGWSPSPDPGAVCCLCSRSVDFAEEYVRSALNESNALELERLSQSVGPKLTAGHRYQACGLGSEMLGFQS